MVYNCTESILSTLYPSRCRLCQAPTKTTEICEKCQLSLPYNQHSCTRCALPLPPESPPYSHCGHCLKSPPAFDLSISPYLYQAPMNRLITDFKFGHILAMGRLLSDLLGEHLSHLNTKPELIIPMPLHPSRLRERGFNQALELARPLAKRLKIPLDYQCCQRDKPTESQAGLTKKARIKNMRGAFEVVRPINAHHIVILDDVLTTGSSANELARILKQAGVTRVDVWTLARTP